MSKPIRIHLRKNGKQTFCGIVINPSISIANKGEVFFELNKEPIMFNSICKNCGSLFSKNPINKNYINTIKENEKIKEYTDKLPKTIRSMNYYKKKLQLNWNNKNTSLTDKLNLQVKSNPEGPIDSNNDKIVLNTYVNTGNQSIEEIAIVAEPNNDQIIELTPEMEINPIEIGQKTDKGKIRELRKNGLLPFIKKMDKSINRIQNGLPIAMVHGFGNNWKVIEEMSSMSNCNSIHVKELSGWIPIELAQKIYNQYVINRVMD